MRIGKFQSFENDLNLIMVTMYCIDKSLKYSELDVGKKYVGNVRHPDFVIHEGLETERQEWGRRGYPLRFFATVEEWRDLNIKKILDEGENTGTVG